MKLLIWLVIVLAVVVWLQRAKKNLAQRTRDAMAAAEAARAAGGAHSAHTADATAGRQPPAIEQMVQCAQCGVHFPVSEARRGSSGDVVFCCDEHRKLFTHTI